MELECRCGLSQHPRSPSCEGMSSWGSQFFATFFASSHVLPEHAGELLVKNVSLHTLARLRWQQIEVKGVGDSAFAVVCLVQRLRWLSRQS